MIKHQYFSKSLSCNTVGEKSPIKLLIVLLSTKKCHIRCLDLTSKYLAEKHFFEDHHIASFIIFGPLSLSSHFYDFFVSASLSIVSRH
jgi:hypothetical protein